MVSHRVQISRGAAATQPAVERHFNELKKRYGIVHVINLLGSKEGESVLSEEYNNRILSLNEKSGTIGSGKYNEKDDNDYDEWSMETENPVHIYGFDFNHICKNGNYENVNYLLVEINEILESFAFFLVDLETNTPIFYQKGVFRTNCVDW